MGIARRLASLARAWARKFFAYAGMAAISASAAALPAFAQNLVEVDRIVAVVNDEAITQVELDRRVAVIEAQLQPLGCAHQSLGHRVLRLGCARLV